MNIDIECIGLLSLILQDSPKDRQLILCILARSNTVPTRITFTPNTDYPTFYGYTNSRVPLYLMGKGVLSNVPREGYTKRLIPSHYLSHAETIINRAKNWDIHQKLMSVSKFITLDNKTAYKDAEVFLVFRDKAVDYIKDYATSHEEELSSFLGLELSKEVLKTETSAKPKTKPTIRLKSLELIAIEIGELDTGHNLVDFLIECGVDKRLIVYPNTKWRMVYAVLVELACSKNDKDKETLFKIIGNAVHPLMHRGNTVSAEVLESKFDDYLNYDNLELFYNKKEGVYEVIGPLSEDERQEILAELEEEEKKQQEFLYQPENKEKISLLRKTYQALMGVVEVFCRNFSRLSHDDTVELNKHYLALDKTVWSLIDELKLVRSFDAYKKYPRPFTNLFSAEKELDGDISWDVIRREMSARFGEIETLYQRVNASDILAEPDKQKQLNDVMLYLSKLKEKTKEIERDGSTKEPSATKIEITKMPELQIEGLKEIAKAKKRDDKPKFLYKLPAGTRWEEMTIKFLDDENILIQVKQFKHNASYKEMGFIGKGNNPNPSEAWIFLKVLAQVNGELTIKDTKARDKYKKQKELLAKSLQSYFSIDYDPFYPYRSSSEKSGNSYKIKITLIPPTDTKEKTNTNKDNNDDLGIKEYLDEQNPQVYEDE